MILEKALKRMPNKIQTASQFMKKILFLCVCTSLLCGCNNGQRERCNQTATDSIAKSGQLEKEKLEKARTDSLAVIAWGDLKFGMTKEKALKTEALKNGNVEGNTISMDFDTRFALEQTFGLRELREFEVLFKENELYWIGIFSSKVTALHIDDLVNDCKILSENFSKKMGEPVTSVNKNVDVFSFNEGEKFLYAQFGIGDKCVLIELGETYSGSEYFYEVSIDNWKYPKKKHEETPEEKAQREKRTEERQRIIDNSF